MNTLLQKATIDKTTLKSTLTRAAAFNLSSLSEPCFKPPTKKHYYDFLMLCHLSEQDVKQFTKEMWHGRIEARFQLHMDPISNFYIFLMWYFLHQHDQAAFKTVMLFYVVRHYRALLDKHLQFCNEDTFKYALDTLTKTHLFSRERTIGNALQYLSSELAIRYQKDIETINLDGISRFITVSRHRISQSIKSFAEAYYRASKEGSKIKTSQEPTDDDENAFQYQSMQKDERLIIEISKKITVYKYIDIKAQEDSRQLTKINTSLATLITNTINDVKYTDEIILIFKLFVRDLQQVRSLCGKDFYKLVRDLMAIKRTTSPIYFKQQINLLLMKILEEKYYKKQYDKLTSQSQFLINLFLAYYLTIIFRNSVC
jgi:hypothetical protein